MKLKIDFTTYYWNRRRWRGRGRWGGDWGRGQGTEEENCINICQVTEKLEISNHKYPKKCGVTLIAAFVELLQAYED